MRVLVISAQKGDPQAEWQVLPFRFFKKRLKSELDLETSFAHATTLEDIEREALAQAQQVDAICFRPAWAMDPEKLTQVCARIRAQLGPEKKLVLIDPFDQTSSRFFGALPHLDSLIKYMCLKDPTLYRTDFAGGNYMTDRLATEFGHDLGEWHVGSQVPEGQEHKIRSSWFVVQTEILQKVMRRQSGLWKHLGQPAAKEWDVFCHVSCGERDVPSWYGAHRSKSVEVLETVAAGRKFSVAAEYKGEPRLPRKDYLRRSSRTRVVVSPLGWGEITMRAYEAVLSGAVLMQPDVSHIDTCPDIFVPGETYVPLKWDFSDLAEKVTEVLDNYEQYQGMVQAAERAFVAAYEGDHCVNKIRELLL